MEKNIHVILFAVSVLLLVTTILYAQNEFITVWKTDNPDATNNNKIAFPGIGINYTIELYKDGLLMTLGSTATHVIANHKFEGLSKGEYHVRITHSNGCKS